MTGKIFIIGWDGAPHPLISSWMQEGKLKNLKKLVEQGSFGILESTMPFLTPPAWTSFFTGENPGRHRIFDFIKIDRQHNFNLISSHDIKAKPFWQQIKNRSIIVNVPITYPPKEFNGLLVSGMLTPSTSSDFTYPKTLRNEILKKIPDYKITLQWENYKDNKELFLKELYLMTEQRHNLIKYLMKNKTWKIFFGVFIGADRLQHLFWDSNELLRYYEKLDSYLGEYLNELDESDTVLIVSDHGFGEIRNKVSINGLLKQERLLETKGSQGSFFLRRLGLTKSNLVKFLRFLGVNLENLSRKLPSKIKNMFPSETESVFRDVDFSRTKAFMIGQGEVIINTSSRFSKGIVSDAEYDAIRDTIIEKIRSFDRNKKIIKNIYKKEEVFTDNPKDAPDLIIEPAPGYSISKTIDDNVLEDPGEMRADHEKEGVFAVNKKLDQHKIKIEEILRLLKWLK